MFIPKDACQGFGLCEIVLRKGDSVMQQKNNREKCENHRVWSGSLQFGKNPTK